MVQLTCAGHDQTGQTRAQSQLHGIVLKAAGFCSTSVATLVGLMEQPFSGDRRSQIEWVTHPIREALRLG